MKNQVIGLFMSSQYDVVAVLAITKAEELLIGGVIRRVNPDSGTKAVIEGA